MSKQRSKSSNYHHRGSIFGCNQQCQGKNPASMTNQLTVLAITTSSTTFSFMKVPSMTMTSIGAFSRCRMTVAPVLVLRRQLQAGGTL